jgi:hypothetical protein
MVSPSKYVGVFNALMSYNCVKYGLCIYSLMNNIKINSRDSRLPSRQTLRRRLQGCKSCSLVQIFRSVKRTFCLHPKGHSSGWVHFYKLNGVTSQKTTICSYIIEIYYLITHVCSFEFNSQTPLSTWQNPLSANVYYRTIPPAYIPNR